MIRAPPELGGPREDPGGGQVQKRNRSSETSNRGTTVLAFFERMIHQHRRTENAPDGSEATVHSGWGFAYQGGAGVAIKVAGGLSIRLGYRLLGTLETTYTHEDTDSDTLALVPDRQDKIISAIALPLLVHRIELGLRYQL